MKLGTAFCGVAIALSLAACGGGGGTGIPNSNVVTPTTTTPSTPVVPPVTGADSFRTAEYYHMGGQLDQVHAADAYALGYTGQGVKIGFVDFNFDFSYSDVAFDPASLGANPQSVAIYTAQIGSAPSSDQHGLAVAATAAALKNDIGGHGIAFNATVLAVDYFSDVNDSVVAQGGVLYHVSDPWTYITSRGARIINTSYGYEASDVIANPPHVSQAYVLASPATAVVNGALLVASAGNAHGSSPSLSNMDIIADLQTDGVLDSGAGAFIIVGSVDANNQISSFSDRAGTAMNYYMVAPGENFVLPWNGGTALVSGTSFAAPMVSGAAAIIMQRWPNLSARDVANILFASATDLGAPGVDAVYGHGLLNVAAALQPIGVTTFAVADPGAVTVSGTAMVLGSLFGDAPALHAALSQVMILDSFKRDFELDLSNGITSRPNLPDMFGVMEERLGWHYADFQVGSATSFSFDVRRQPDDGIVPFQTLSGPQDHSIHETVFRLSGIADGIGWAAGTGLSLHDGMTQAGESAFAGASLTNAFSPMVGAAPGTFAVLRLALDGDTGLSLGAAMAENQGLTQYLRTPFRNSDDTASVKLDHAAGNAHFALELGDSTETGGMLGSLASGGLKMAGRASTAWTTASAETALDAHWSFRAAFTLAATDATHPEASLITAIGPVYASSFALGVARENLLQDGDGLAFTFGQPLRAEHGQVTLTTGVARDWTTGGVIMGDSRASLVPSGREFDLESGYRFSLAGFAAGANLAYAVDADHTRGQNAVLALFTMSRTF